MDDMHELITVEAFNRAVITACIAWLVLCLVVAGVAHLRKKRRVRLLAVAWGVLGPIVLCLWRFYSWMMRVEPQTGYVGLHRVSAFAISLVAFVLVGAALGLVFSRLYRSTDCCTHN